MANMIYKASAKKETKTFIYEYIIILNTYGKKAKACIVGRPCIHTPKQRTRIYIYIYIYIYITCIINTYYTCDIDDEHESY